MRLSAWKRPLGVRSLRTRVQTATSETESKSLDLSICVHHYTLRAPCPKGQGIFGLDEVRCLSPILQDLRNTITPEDRRTTC